MGDWASPFHPISRATPFAPGGVGAASGMGWSMGMGLGWWHGLGVTDSLVISVWLLTNGSLIVEMRGPIILEFF
jgi:hypothetical protein